MTLISHEIPKQLFPYHDFFNDYPYVLGHLCNLDQEYREFYIQKLKTSRYSIFDNSAFELGESIDNQELLELVLEFKPTHFVLPDVINNGELTIERTEEFLQIANPLHSVRQKAIGVIQGKNISELLKTLDFYKELSLVDIIAIPYDTIKYSTENCIEFFGEEISHTLFKQLIRPRLFNLIQKELEGYKIHFLGTQNVREFTFYTTHQKQSIYSVDTSAPIIAGWKNRELNTLGMKGEKITDKLADNLDISLNTSQIQIIGQNINQFKNYWK